MALTDPLGHARRVTTPKQAARLMARLEHETSYDESASEEWHGQAGDALHHLRTSFPDAHKLDAYREPPASSPSARAGMRREEREQGGGEGQRTAQAPRRATRTSSRGPVRRGAAGGRAVYRAQRTIQQSSGVGAVSSSALQAIGAGVGLTLLYLVLSPNGSTAFKTLLNGVASALRIFVGPYDPLNPSGPASTAQVSQAPGTAGETPGHPITPAQARAQTNAAIVSELAQLGIGPGAVPRTPPRSNSVNPGGSALPNYSTLTPAHP
jgi:hypothetical protein